MGEFYDLDRLPNPMSHDDALYFEQAWKDPAVVAATHTYANSGHQSYGMEALINAVYQAGHAAALWDGIREFVARVDARAEADILAGNPIEGAHNRALRRELVLLNPRASASETLKRVTVLSDPAISEALAAAEDAFATQPAGHAAALWALPRAAVRVLVDCMDRETFPDRDVFDATEKLRSWLLATQPAAAREEG